jgi:hypothetical protein
MIRVSRNCISWAGEIRFVMMTMIFAPLLLAMSQLVHPGGGWLPDYCIVGSLGGAPPVARHAYDLRQGERLVLSIAAMEGAMTVPGNGGPHRGEPAPGVYLHNEDMNKISWFLIKPAIKEYSNLWAKGNPNVENVHLDPIEYVRIPIPNLDNMREADISVMVSADELGTFYVGVETASDPGTNPLRAPFFMETAPLHMKYPYWIVQVSRRIDDSYIGRLTELFQTPFLVAPMITDKWVHETDERMGSDCASFAIYGKRRQGFRVPYCGPLGIYKYLTEIGESQVWPVARGLTEVYIDRNGDQVLVGPGGLEPGDIVHFGEQVSVFFADTGIVGILDKDDLLIQCYLGGPTITRIEESGFFHRSARIFKWKQDIDRK